MKSPVYLLLILILTLPVIAGERKTSEDFAPRPPDEEPLLNPIPEVFSPRLGLAASAVITVSGIAFTAVTLHQTLDAVMEEPSSAKVQTGILKTGALLAGTAVFAILTDFFLDRIKESREETAEGS